MILTNRVTRFEDVDNINNFIGYTFKNRHTIKVGISHILSNRFIFNFRNILFCKIETYVTKVFIKCIRDDIFIRSNFIFDNNISNSLLTVIICISYTFLNVPCISYTILGKIEFSIIITFISYNDDCS